MLVKGVEARSTTYQPDEAARSIAKLPPGCRAYEADFSHVASSASWAGVRILYTNPGTSARFAELRVNGSVATRIAFPPTGPEPASVSVMALLDQPNATNILRFSAECDPAPMIDAIRVK
jgi:hypothetical protein